MWENKLQVHIFNAMPNQRQKYEKLHGNFTLEIIKTNIRENQSTVSCVGCHVVVYLATANN